MINIYKTNKTDNKLEETTEFNKGVWINMQNPTKEEIDKVCESININETFIRYCLDYEEQARIDVEDDVILFIIDVPIVENTEDGEVYTTIPLGMIFVREDYFITICLQENQIITDFENNLIKNVFTHKKTRFLLQILYKNASCFLNYLKLINKRVEVAEKALQKSMKNQELIRMLNLEKSLVYFSTSLRSNEVVMEKILRGKVIKLYEEDEDLLEDVIVENKQAIEMSKIYSDILSGTMDAYASIISNNLNIVMRFLASVTILLSIPTLITGLIGMNVPIPFQGREWTFYGIIGISLVIIVIVGWWLKKKDMF